MLAAVFVNAVLVNDIAMSSKCMVTYKDRNVVVNITGQWKPKDLLDNLKRTGALKEVDFTSASLTVYDEDFATHVEVADDFIITDKARFMIKETAEYRIVDVLDVEVLPAQQVEMLPRTVYTLPTPPLTLKLSMENHERGKLFKHRRQLIHWLYDDLKGYSRFSGRRYMEAASALVHAYPNLADCTGTGYDSWKQLLVFRGKYKRSTSNDSGGATDGSTGSGTSGAGTSGASASGAPPAKKPRKLDDPTPSRASRLLSISYPCDAEDSDTLQAHTMGMQKELKKAKPNFAYIEDSMARTFRERRSWISLDLPTVQQVTDKYPAMMLSAMIQQEFLRQTGVCLKSTLPELLAARSGKILETSRKKRHLSEFFGKLDQMTEEESEHPQKDLLLTASVCLLPSLVKERKEAFISTYEPDAMHKLPTITYEGRCVLTAQKYCAELEHVKMEEPDLPAALATLIALYWAYDIVFAVKAQKTFDLLCRLLGLHSGVKTTPLVHFAHVLLE